MGLYVNLFNLTKKESCGEWKGSGPSPLELIEIINSLKWDPTDIIYEMCTRCPCYLYKYNSETGSFSDEHELSLEDHKLITESCSVYKHVS
jgi:hypothetical protein